MARTYHHAARERLAAGQVFAKLSPSAQAAKREAEYRAVLHEWFRGRVSSAVLLEARVAMMEAWSRAVDAKCAQWRQRGAVA